MDAEQIRYLRPRLADYLSRFSDCFIRRDTREHLTVYVQGQLSDLPQKSVEPIALKAGVASRTLQEFLASYSWNEDGLRQHLHEIVVSNHASPQSIGLNETSDPKKGNKTPGVQRQYCGAAGKQDNCIVTVRLEYAVDDFHCLGDQEWKRYRIKDGEKGPTVWGVKQMLIYPKGEQGLPDDAHLPIEGNDWLALSRSFTAQSGYFAFGLVPTMQNPELESADLFALWLRFAAMGGNILEIAKKTIVTATCGLGLATPASAVSAFEQCKLIGEKIAKVASSP